MEMSEEQKILTVFDGKPLLSKEQRLQCIEKINHFHILHPGIFWTLGFGDDGIIKSIKVIGIYCFEEWVESTPFWSVEHFNYKFINSNKDVK